MEKIKSVYKKKLITFLKYLPFFFHFFKKYLLVIESCKSQNVALSPVDLYLSPSR